MSYSSEKNIQIVIALLKAHNVRKIVVSPGGTNVSFVASVQKDSFFEIYSCTDERSAAYMACGLSAETNEIVAINCTGATSSRNYMPALTEAFYRRLPILAITSHCGEDWLNNLRPQQIDRKQGPSDVFVGRYYANFVKDNRDFNACVQEVNRALLSLTKRDGGPVLLNLYTNFDSNFDCIELPKVRTIRRISVYDTLPSIQKNEKVAVFIGSHRQFTDEEESIVDAFCESYDAVVISDHTSGYRGKYAVNVALPFVQSNYDSPCNHVNLLIHIGQISGDYYSSRIQADRVWRVDVDGEIRDTFHTLEYIFEMKDIYFFKQYIKGKTNKKHESLERYNKEYDTFYSMIPDLPFSNLWIAQQTHTLIPDNSRIHFGILNSLRSWNFFKLKKSIHGFCNVGGFGIDGTLSTVVGASFAHKDILYFAIVGDLSFFYDMNALGNRHIGRNLRILLINNGKGTEFKNRESFAYQFGDDADQYMAAMGHNGDKSSKLVRHYAEDLGFKYIVATNKEDYLKNLPVFVSPQIGKESILFEVFTNSQEESTALDMLCNMYHANEEEVSMVGQLTKLKQEAKHTIKNYYNNAIDKLKLK